MYIICMFVYLNIHCIDGPSVVTKLSEKWGSLTDDEKKEWKDKASKGMS